MIILESDTETSAEHGSAPDARTIDQLLELSLIHI